MSENIQSYSLPSGVSIDSMYGYDDEIPESATPLWLVVSNSNSGDVNVKFPAGLVFSPSIPADYQYMMVLKDFSFTASGGGASTAIIPTYGCNEDLDFPDDDSHYDIAGREWDRETQELLDIVAPKALNTEDAVELAQQALDEITGPDFPDGLTDSTKTALQALP